MSKQPKIKSARQHIRLWFEFLNLVILDSEISVDDNFYLEWGDVSEKFDDWWNKNNKLFGSTVVKKITKVTNSPNTLNISIPLNQPVSKSIIAIKELIELEQSERLTQLGVDKHHRLKTLSSKFGKFEITQGIEMRGKTLNEILIMYSIWVELKKPPINTKFCAEVVHRLRSRPRSNWIPYLLQVEPITDRKGNLRYDEGQIRQVRRYIQKGKKICISVSKGEFPGKSNL